jgi:1-acyl-sn-glycerol-3-phosphate acyltransferase
MSREHVAIRPQIYLDERTAEHFEPFHAWARQHGADWVQDLVRLAVVPFCMLVYRARAIDAELVPASGPAIIAPNHFSTLDHFFVAMYLRRRVRFMAKSQLFRGPLAWIMRHGGAFPVRRGHRDEEAMVSALEILAGGGVVVIYPEGGRSRSAQIGEQARRGVGRLALESGAPVVPVAIHGSQRARNWKRLEFPTVLIRYGAPLHFAARTPSNVGASTREDQQAVADDVLGTVRQLWASLDAREPRGGRLIPRPSLPWPSENGHSAHVAERVPSLMPKLPRLGRLREVRPGRGPLWRPPVARRSRQAPEPAARDRTARRTSRSA